VRFQKIAGTWIPIAADSDDYFLYPSKIHYSIANQHIEIEQMIPNPTAKDLGEFIPDDIQDGAMVMALDGELLNKKVFWRAKQVIDSEGQVIADFRDRH
jgi:hypothetical protein